MLTNNFEIVLYLITNIFKTYTYKIFLDNFLIKYRIPKKISYLAFTAYFVLNSAIFIFDASSLFIVVSNLFLVFCLCNVYIVPIKSKIIFSTFVVMLGIIAEVISGFIVSALANTTINTTLSKPILFMVGMVLSKIVLFIVVKIICVLFSSSNDHDIPMEYWLVIFAVPIGSIYIVYIMLLQNQNSDQLISPLTVISIAITLLINFAIFFLYERTLRLNHIAMQNAILATQNELFIRQYKIMEANYNEIRSLRHDLKGHLTTILSYEKEGNVSHINSYIEGLLGKIEVNDIICDCGIVAIDSIVNPKLNEAKQLGAKVTSDIYVFESIEFDPIDLTIILNNILDNAIDACKAVSRNERFIDVYIKYEKKTLFFNIRNSCLSSLLKQDGETFVSGKKNSPNMPHGIGLKNVRSVVQKYNGEMDLKCDGNRFVCSILLYAFDEQGENAPVTVKII